MMKPQRQADAVHWEEDSGLRTCTVCSLGITELRNEQRPLEPAASKAAEEDTVNNKVVTRFADGRTIKGTTVDFLPTRGVFHVTDATAPAGATPVEIRVQELKALFFVKNLAGNPKRAEPKEPGPPRPAAGRRIRVVFKDGEVLVGTTTGYQPDRPGFFLEPADASLNEERCYVVMGAAKEITLL
jgi:hypothetical protein